MANEPNKGGAPGSETALRPSQTNDLVEHGSERVHEEVGEHEAGRSAADFDKMEPQVYAAPETEKREGFLGYPMIRFHPIYGMATAADPNEAYKLFQPSTDWFETAEIADMHRTHTEAMQVVHHNQHVKHAASIDAVNGREPAPATGKDAPKGIVRNSVAAQASLDAGRAEPF